MDTVLRFITVLLIFVFVLVITHFTTKFVANLQKSQCGGGNIKLLESARLNSNTYIQIVRIAKKVLVLSVSKDNVSTLCELSEDEYNDMCNGAPDGGASVSTFEKVLNSAKEALPIKKN